MLCLKFNCSSVSPQASEHDAFINIPMAFILTLLSIFTTRYFLIKTRDWWKLGYRWTAVGICVLGLILCFTWFFILKILAIKMKQKLEQAEKLQFIREIPYRRTNSDMSEQEELRGFLKHKMFYSGSNLENILNMFNEIRFSHIRGYHQKILISGNPGTGKTQIIEKIISLIPNGGILVEFSALIRFKDLQHTDVSMEISKINDLCDKCQKKHLILVFDDSELFLRKRQQEEHIDLDEQTPREIKMNKNISNFLGILCNFWLSVLSSKDITIIIISNMEHTIKPTIDPANARRLEKYFTIYLPNFHERLGILKNYLKNYKFYGNEHEIFTELSNLTDGFSGRDLKLICEEAKNIAKHNVINLYDFIDLILRNLEDHKNKQQNLKRMRANDDFIGRIRD